MEDSGPMPLSRRASDHRGVHKWFRFDPTLSTGALLQTATILVSVGTFYGAYVRDQTQVRADVTQIQEIQKRDRADVEKVAERLGGDLKEIKNDVKEVGLKLAEIRGQQQGSKK